MLQNLQFAIIWPGSISVSGGKLFVLDNHYYDRNISVGKFIIYYIILLVDEISSNQGYTIYSFKLNFFSAFIGGIFLIAIIIAIFLIILNREKYSNNLNYEKNVENEENVNELNRRLKE